MKSPNHPVWGLLNLAVVLAFVTVFSWLNASNFDHTELKMIGELAAVGAAWELVKGRMNRS